MDGKSVEVLQQQWRESLFWKWRNRWTNGVAGVSVFISGDSVYAKKSMYSLRTEREEKPPCYLMYAGTETV